MSHIFNNIDGPKPLLSITIKMLTFCSFSGAFFHGNEIYIATELMDGGSLDRYKPIPEPELGRMAVMVVHGLQYLWSMGIMHRDVKPSNMLVNTLGEAMYCC